MWSEEEEWLVRRRGRVAGEEKSVWSSGEDKKRVL
jgi:hypothetical protein